MTSLYWPNYSSHPWKGTPFSPKYTQNFASRLQEVGFILHGNLEIRVSGEGSPIWIGIYVVMLSSSIINGCYERSSWNYGLIINTAFTVVCFFIEGRKNVTGCNMNEMCMKWQQYWELRCAGVSTGIQCGICSWKCIIHNIHLLQLSGTLNNWWSSCLEIANTEHKIIF